MRRITVGVTGGIAAYKIPSLVSLLMKEDFDVEVVMTETATRIISPTTFSSLTGKRTYTDFWAEDLPQPLHIRLSARTDVLVIAPATANTVAKLATGIADNLLTAVALALPQDRCRILAPSMEENMLLHPATQSNIKRLEQWGWRVVEPEEGRLATGRVGKGRLPEPQSLLKRILSIMRLDRSSRDR